MRRSLARCPYASEIIDINILLFVVKEDDDNDFARFEGLRWENPLQTT